MSYTIKLFNDETKVVIGSISVSVFPRIGDTIRVFDNATTEEGIFSSRHKDYIVKDVFLMSSSISLPDVVVVSEVPKDKEYKFK